MVAPLSPARVSRGTRKDTKPARASIKAVPGYTILVLDTNILVGPGDLLQQLVESRKWTIVIPLAGESFFVTILRLIVADFLINPSLLRIQSSLSSMD